MINQYKQRGKMGIILAIIVFILIVISVIYFQQSDIKFEPAENTPIINSDGYTPPSGWILKETESGSFYYPTKIETDYIATTDWPPELQTLSDSFSCTRAGEETDRAGRTETITVEGREYCRTITLEGAAGSTYGLYAYTFSKSGETVALTFGLRFPQCANYEEPEASECRTETDSFDIDSLADRVARSIRVSE
jgi:hypothetical protein